MDRAEVSADGLIAECRDVGVLSVVMRSTSASVTGVGMSTCSAICCKRCTWRTKGVTLARLCTTELKKHVFPVLTSPG